MRTLLLIVTLISLGGCDSGGDSTPVENNTARPVDETPTIPETGGDQIDDEEVDSDPTSKEEEDSNPDEEVPPESEEVPSEVLASRLDVATKLYDSSYETPEGFFEDKSIELGYFQRDNVQVYHMLTADGFEQCVSKELDRDNPSTVDFGLTFVDELGVYVSFTVDEKYVEFQYEVGNGDGTSSPHYVRFFYCSFVERDGVNPTALNGYGGQLMSTDLTRTDLKEFVEYMWQFSEWDGTVVNVLSTSTSGIEDPTSRGIAIKTLNVGRIVPNNDKVCDTIEVGTWTWLMNGQTGEMSREYETTDTFRAQKIGTSPELC